LTDLSYVNLKWLLDKLYKPLICNEFIYGKTPFYDSGAMFAYEKGALADRLSRVWCPDLWLPAPAQI
jgi:hypothetical protein